MTSSIDGLVSGLNTSTIISQLMQIEAAPQARLQKQASQQQAVRSSYQAVNARILAVRTAAEALTSTDTWNSVKVTASGSAATGVAGIGALTGTATFDVVRLATAHVLTSGVPTTGSVTTGGNLTVTVGATSTQVAVGTDTAQGVADAVNATSLGVRATVLSTADGQVLQFSSTKPGAANAFTLGGLSAPTSVVTQGADARIGVGTAGAGGFSLDSADNTFTGLIPGVTITVSKVESAVTVTSARDNTRLADAMQNLVSAVNAAAADIATRTAYDPTTKSGGALTGDPVVRSLRQGLLSVVSTGVPGLGSAASIGVSLDRSGALTFNRDTFLAAVAATPDAVRTAVSTGFAENYRVLADSATNSTSGRLTLAVQGKDALVRTLNRQIDDWTVRLADRRTALQHKYTTLETALGKLKDQSTWLAGQLAALPTSKSTG